MSYVEELSGELGRVGFRGSRRARILAEVEDHLREGGEVSAFGSPRLVAQRFADELASSFARRGAVATFAALAPIGIAYAFLFAPIHRPPDITSGQIVSLGVAVAFLMLLAPQIALASGVLAVARAWRLRTGVVVPADEVRFLRRRAGVALAAGIVTLASLAVYAIDYRAGLPGWWVDTALATAAGGTVLLAVVASSVGRGARLRPQVAGTAGDVFDDVAPIVDRLPFGLRGHPWRFCLLVAAGIAAAALVVGGLDEGPRNAVAEFVAVCAGFAVLGRYLGLTR